MNGYSVNYTVYSMRSTHFCRSFEQAVKVASKIRNKHPNAVITIIRTKRHCV